MRTALLILTKSLHFDVGKLSPALDEAGPSAPNNSHRLFITDKNSKLTFLIDTGANISVIPKSRNVQQRPSTFKLYAANNTVIPTYGEKYMDLDLNLQRSFRWKFVIAAVSKPIIGADFLNHHKILVDVAGRTLIDKQTNTSVRASLCKTTEPTVRSIDVKQKYHDILRDYPDVTRLSSMKEAPKHSVQHYIETTGPPLHCKARPIPPHRYSSVKKEFETMMAQGLCRPSMSPWASPLHVVPKKNGGIRVCGDYRRLNSITKPDRYPVPRLKDFTYQLNGKNIFSTLDLNRAYQQLPVHTDDIEKTAIITPFGLYEFPRMCPGLKNAGQTFQRFIHQVLQGLDFCYPFIDDVIISSQNENDHVKHLRQVLERFNDYGVTINPSKCVFGAQEVKFLGYMVSPNGIKPPADKVAAITNFPKPATIEELRRFLGIINFYRDAIPHAATIQAPLNAYMHNSKRKDKTQIIWTDETNKAFSQCKTSLENAALLAHPSHDAPIALMCDASNTSAGAVLQQYVNNKWLPLGYFSKKFSSAQQKYSTFDRELLSIYMAVKYFRKMFEGRPLIIFTDHKPLTFVLNKKVSDSETPRRTRQLLFISEFTNDIRHISGKNNIVADSLSRIETISCPTTIDYTLLAAEQEKDDELPKLLKQDNLKLKTITLPNSDKKIYCEVSTPNIRPYLPMNFRSIAFDAVHNHSHPGVRATRKLISDRFFWPSMNSDTANWARQCIPCQQSKVHRHTSSDYGVYQPVERFQHIHVDIVGPLPPSRYGHRYLLTIIDRKTRWPEAIPLRDITAEIVAKEIYDRWIARFGCPATLTSDQGRQFESQLFLSLTKYLGIKKTRTTAYHPQCNGIIERWHRSLKTAITAYLVEKNTKWLDALPTVLLGLRAAPRSDTGVSAAQLTYGCSIRLPGDFFDNTDRSTKMDYDYVDNLRRAIGEYKEAGYSKKNPNIYVHQDLQTCKNVFLRVDTGHRSLQPPYEGPYPVLRRDKKVFTLQLPGREANISIDRLKPAYVININHFDGSNTTSADDVNALQPGRQIKHVVRFA